MTQLIKLPTEELLIRFGSGGHKPGSGSAAALLGLIACKLLQTVISLSAGREKYLGVEAQLTLANQNILEDMEPILLTAVQDDSEQFDKVISARRDRDEQTDPAKKRAFADRALAELRAATEIPMNIAEACLSLAEKGLVVFDLGFQAARGDSGVAISAALAGASGCISIVYLNLTSFKGSEWAIQTRKRAEELGSKTAKLQVELANRLARLQQEVLAKEP